MVGGSGSGGVGGETGTFGHVIVGAGMRRAMVGRREERSGRV